MTKTFWGIFSIFAAAAALMLLGVDPTAATGVALFAAEGAGAGAITKDDIAGLTKQVGELGEKLKKELDEATKKVGELGTELATKTAAGEKVSTELKEQVDKALTEQGELRKSIDKLGGNLTEVMQELAKRKFSAEPEVERTPGELFVESEDFKKIKGDSSFRGRIRVGMKAVTNVGTGGVLVPADRRPGIIALPERRLTIRDLLTPGRTNSNAIQYVRETGFTNNAAVVRSEGALKPESDIDFELVTRSVATIAHWIQASKQILDDAPMLQSTIDGRLRYGLALREEDQLLNGDGTGSNLFGIIPQATAYAAAFAPASPQRIDQIRLALLQSELAEFPATGIVLHPTDWARIELLKDGENRYLLSNPQNETQPRLWARPVVSTQAMDETEFLVGAFRLGAQIFDREDANVEVSTEDRDNFVRNLVTIRAEERLVLAVYRPEAFVHGTFS